MRDEDPATGRLGPPVPLLGAPTASGKSALALRLARDLPVEVVTADAMQAYRGLDVATAKPSVEERARVPHHLIDVVDPGEPFGVADWVALAEDAIDDVRARGKVPLVIGGTGFYLRALARGLPGAPAADPEAQAPLWEALERDGLGPLVRELEAAAPEDAARAARNPRRVVRALEVLRRTGRPPSAFPARPPRHRARLLALVPPLEALRPRIRARVDAMLAAGLVEEARRVRARWPDAPTAAQAIGYKEVWPLLEGRATQDEVRDEVVRATVRYAKRQRTWFRREPDAERVEALADEAEPRVRAWLERALGGA